MKSAIRRLWLKGSSLFLCCLSTGGCMLGPDYAPPQLNVPLSWRIDIKQAQSIANIKWWEDFQDPELTKLVELGLKENQDLVRAAAVVQQFYALYGVSRSELFPQVGAGAGYSRYKSSEELEFAASSHPHNRFDIALSLFWELDLWGRIRRSNEAAMALVLGQEAARRGVILSLVSSISSSYVDLRRLDAALEVTKRTLGSRENSLRIMRDKFQGGVIPELDVRQVESEVLTAKTDIPFLEQSIAEKEHLISLLLSHIPGPIGRGREIAELSVVTTVPPGLPSDLLQQRPDVQAAEETLRAATAQIGVAITGYFPRLALTGDYGFSSIELEDWLSNPAQAWQFGPQISVPVFTAGRVASEVELAKARAAEAVAAYRQTVLTAFKEVNDAFVAFQKSAERERLLAEQVGVLEKYLSLANDRYNEGQTSYLEVLDAERRYFEAQRNHVDSQSVKALSYIAIYRALAGGWVTEAEKLAPVPTAPQ